MARPDPDFTSRMVPLMLAHARSRGVALQPLLGKYRLATDLNLEQPGREELTTSLPAVRELSFDLAAALNDASFGLSLARGVPKGAYGVAEFLIRSTTTLRQAFESLIRFQALVAPSQSFRLEETETEAQVHNSATHHPGALGRHLHEYSTAILANVLFAVSDAKLNRVWFCNPRPADVQPLVDFFQTPNLEFDQGTNGFAIALQDLETPVKSGDQALFSFLEEHAAAALASRPKADELIDRLRHGIREALKSGEPNIEWLSAKLHLRGRTLQRRLSELHTTFQDVLDEVRFDLARVYLKDERLDLSQVAYLLGYSELRAFDRAFRRWSGVAPRAWRAKPE